MPKERVFAKVHLPEGNLDLPKLEQEVLKFWHTNQIFQKSLKQRQATSDKRKSKTFVFYEGPPYANGKPGIHHVLARVVKDVILRYKSMRGYYVPRRAGWDTHGLPVEIAAEKALGLKSKKDIEKFGIERFNQEAKKAVWIYKDDWEKMTNRIGYWLDLKNAYVTYAPEYIETLWWTLKRIWERKLLYQGHKVVPWCTRCGTALSSHELAQGYQEVADNSVYAKFKLKPNQKFGAYTTKSSAYILSWTTTPWTLPGNVALAVGEKIAYAIFSDKRQETSSKEIYIVAKEMVDKVVGQGNYNIIGEIKGKDLVGLKYEPLFNIPALKNPKSYQIYPADFVTTTDGTGVVHTAVMYGEDDYALGKKIGLPEHHTVTEEGKFTSEVPGGLAGLPVKAEQTTEKIFAYLKKNGNFLKSEEYVHEYPNCWRCGTPIIYYARTSWFIAMSKLRKELLTANQTTNWNPAHLKAGRFGEWLKDAKDWNLSRERYWGTPLPIWECIGKKQEARSKKQAGCGHMEVVGGLDELSQKAGQIKNNYWVMRHGEAESNVKDIIDSEGTAQETLRGRVEAERSVQKFAAELKRQRQKIDLIITSDALRARETAKIAQKVLGIKKLISDKRLHEIRLAALSGGPDSEYHKQFPTYLDQFEKAPTGGESLRDLRARQWALLQDLEKKYKGKKILLVSHEYPIWMLTATAAGWSEPQAIRAKEAHEPDFIHTGEIRELVMRQVPRNPIGETDLHRPYVDVPTFACRKCHGTMRRVKEVMDVWYDSGAMPFAQAHWPFAQNQNAKIKNKNLGIDYPADYIAEGMDQTRGWFYTLLAVATAMGYDAPYKNVISLGLINDKFGKKMSKSKGNIIEPDSIIDKYGADALRWYFFTATPPGEPKNFDEQELVKASRKFHALLYNSFAFYRTYGQQGSSVMGHGSRNVLDRWILVRLAETVDSATKHLDKYEIREAGLAIESLVDDLSRWYIRRSRKRFSAEKNNKTDYLAASATLHHVLLALAKLSAPFTPFLADALYGSLAGTDDLQSVHLTNWPKIESRIKNKEASLIAAMREVRDLASKALAKRAEVGIKVRQPLQTLSIKHGVSSIKLSGEFLDLLKDEVNVKNITYNSQLTTELELDTEITPELKAEGLRRELTRALQDLRQKAGLKPGDQIAVNLELPEELRQIIAGQEKELKREVGAKIIEYKKTAKIKAEAEIKIEEQLVWLGVRKI